MTNYNHNSDINKQIAELSSTKEARALKSNLLIEIENIKAQLGDRDKRNANGSRMSSEEYWAWKNRCQKALAAKLSQVREINAYLKTQGAPSVEATSNALTSILARLDDMEQAILALTQAVNSLAEQTKTKPSKTGKKKSA
jgi:DNA-binding transcriptional MerR regulator